MAFKKTLASLILGATLAFSGCGDTKPCYYLEGEVIKESGSVVSVIESSGAVFGNESVKFGNPTYVLRVKTEKGIYTINVEGDSQKPLAALAEAIKAGDKV